MLMAESIHIKKTGLLTAGDEIAPIQHSTIDIIASQEIINEGSLNLFGGEGAQPVSTYSSPKEQPAAPPVPEGRNASSFNGTVYWQNGTQFNGTLYRRLEINSTDRYEPRFYMGNGSLFNHTMFDKNGTEFSPPTRM